MKGIPVNKEKIAIVPGSFDPITNGHISIIKKAVRLYDKVYVAVMINDQKEYMFSLEEREEIVKSALSEFDNISVISSRDWLWHLCTELGACAIVKGYRNETDLEYENKMAAFNKEHCPAAETVLIKSEDDMADLSSTFIRERIRNEQSLEKFLPSSAIETIKKIRSRV